MIHDEYIVSAVQPYQARKPYVCPGCEQTISPGTGHVVVVPELAPELRRHWHHGCWHKSRRASRNLTPRGSAS